MPSQLLVVGLTGNWQQIVAQIIAATQDHPEKRAVLTFVVDEAEAEAVKRWHQAKPELHLVVEIAILLSQPDAAMPSDDIVTSWRRTYTPPQLALVLRDDADA